MKPQPRIVRVRRPIPRRGTYGSSQLWEHAAVVGFGVAALMFVIAVANGGHPR